LESESLSSWPKTLKPRVLVVEDDDNVRLEVAAALEDYGFAVDSVLACCARWTALSMRSCWIACCPTSTVFQS
jgi:CheY-like chemotaxis protein